MPLQQSHFNTEGLIRTVEGGLKRWRRSERRTQESDRKRSVFELMVEWRRIELPAVALRTRESKPCHWPTPTARVWLVASLLLCSVSCRQIKSTVDVHEFHHDPPTSLRQDCLEPSLKGLSWLEAVQAL